MKTNKYEITCDEILVAVADSFEDAVYAAQIKEKQNRKWCGIWKNGLPVRTPVDYFFKSNNA